MTLWLWASSAPTPTTTSVACRTCPPARPATAGATLRPRMPAAIVYAQSAPGVITSSKSTTRKVAKRLGSMARAMYVPPIAKWLPLHRECGRFAQRYPRWTRLIAQSSLSYNRKGGSRSPSSPRASPSASRAASAVYATSRPNVSCAGTAPRSTRLADRSLLADRNRTRRGHIHALINPQSPESRSSFEVADEHPPDPAEWSERAVTKRGSWWPDHVEWLSTRSGGLKPAPNALGNRRYQAHAKAPGTYVHAR